MWSYFSTGCHQGAPQKIWDVAIPYAGSTTPNTSKLQSEFHKLLKASLQTSTADIYQRNWNAFRLFHSNTLHKELQFPSSLQNVCLFIIHLHQKGLQYWTIKTYTSTISFIHKLHHLPDPTTTFLVSKALHVWEQGKPSTPQIKPIHDSLTKLALHQPLWQ